MTNERLRSIAAGSSCLAALLLLSLCLIASLLVAFGDLPVIFNQQMNVYHLLNFALVGGLAVTIAVLAAAMINRRLSWLRRPILIVLTFVLSLELLLFAFDRNVVSVAGSPMDAAFRTVSIHGEDIYLPQPTANSPFGFRTPRSDTPQHNGYRILFLGNSYVYGSGSTLETNYPQVVEAYLRKLLPALNVSVFSAGVDGFGAKEDRLVYEYLLDQGYEFDAVVMNFMMGSDPTNDIPGTIRRAIAGQPQRLHQNWFIRTFYPFNSYLFRYALYLKAAFGPQWTDPGHPVATDATCQPSHDFAEFSHERANYYYGPGARQRLYIDYNLNEIDALGDLARAQHAKLYVTLLPDPNGLLQLNRQYYKDKPMDWEWSRRAIREKIGSKWPLFDLAPAFLEQSTFFRCNDVHWNDAGNVFGGRLVAELLAGDIAGQR